MNECEHLSRVGAYHDGELPDAWAAEMERHLADCPECAAELARLRALSRLVSSAAQPEMSPAAMAQLHRRIDQLSGMGLRRMAETLAAIAATILVICSAAFFVLREPAQAGSQWDELTVSEPGIEVTAGSPDDQIASWMVQELSEKDKR
jgi:anti-sigma factor RsiW